MLGASLLTAIVQLTFLLNSMVKYLKKRCVKQVNKTRPEEDQNQKVPKSLTSSQVISITNLQIQMTRENTYQSSEINLNQHAKR
jgi:hypothetical protein